MSFFPSIFVPLPFSLCMERTIHHTYSSTAVHIFLFLVFVFVFRRCPFFRVFSYHYRFLFGWRGPYIIHIGSSSTAVHMFLFPVFFVSLEMSLFPSIFVPLPFSLCMERTIHHTYSSTAVHIFLFLVFVFVFRRCLFFRVFLYHYRFLFVWRGPDIIHIGSSSTAEHMFLFPVFFCFFGDVAFSEYFCTITVFSLYGEYVVRFPLPDGVYLPCDHGLDFRHQLI